LTSGSNINTIDLVIIGFIHMGLLLYVMGRWLNDPFYIEIYHYCLGIQAFLIPLLVNYRELLLWHILFIIFTLATRKIFRGCIVRNVERDNPVTNNEFTKLFNWDLIFPALGVISAVKLYKN
tara:strand:+ start:3263 stop:3628 length:366 start_codon:yes stop_codon:yes gene_type:complete